MATEVSHDGAAIDRLALSRAQHLKSRNNRRESQSDDENDTISDWSESDLECSPVSDFECTSNIDHRTDCDYNGDEDVIDEQLPTAVTTLEHHAHLTDTPLPVICDSIPSTRMSFSSDMEKPKSQEVFAHRTEKKPPTYVRRPPQTPLLPARHARSKETPVRRLTAIAHVLPQQPTPTLPNRRTIPPSPTRLTLRRGMTATSTSTNTHSTKESTLSSDSSIRSGEEQHLQTHQRQGTVSPNFSQTSINNGVISRIYEVKKSHVDDYDYGRLSDVSTLKTLPARNRQKWGTIVHPPFPLGYQHIAPEQVTQAVERLASPVRCRERHTPAPTPSKRYLSVDETEALISRLTKVKPIRSPDQYWPIQQPSRPIKHLSTALKTNNNWKGVGIPA